MNEIEDISAALSLFDQSQVDLPAGLGIGIAKLTKLAFDGGDLQPLLQMLMNKVADGTSGVGDEMDLSIIAQLLGEKDAGLVIQEDVLGRHRLFRSPCRSEPPALRVLALAAAINMGGNTPVEFLLEESDIELVTLYVVDGIGLPSPLPEHDVAIVVASDADEAVLGQIDRIAARWPRPLLNLPSRIGNLDREKLHRLLSGIAGLEMPATSCISRLQLADVATGKASLPAIAEGTIFPVIIRPRGSHAGVGLGKLDDRAALKAYLTAREEQEFFISRFVDYSNDDGMFRKYRIVAVDGQFFACHMAIADRWDIWYLNAGMTFSASKRHEEAAFMQTFDQAFAVRHKNALKGLVERIELDYFTVDCAENKAGELLIFEADNTAVVHNMDPPDLFPYKPPQMHAIFDAFSAMLRRRCTRDL